MSTETSTIGALVTTVARLKDHVGRTLGPTEWRQIDQERVNAFADVTEDHNFIHVDPQRAAQTPFGTTIAHGYLTLSLLAPISQQLIQVTDASTAINYGLDRLRFPAPLKVGSQYRGVGEIVEVTEVDGGVQAKAVFTVEVMDASKPALVAECLLRYYA